MIDRTIQLADHSANIVKRTPQLELMCEPQLSTVVFRYVPGDPAIDSDELNATLRQCLFNRGLAVIGHTRVRNRQSLKFTCMNPTVTQHQLEELLRTIVTQGTGIEDSINHRA
jgi:L-2,4-diaminobutyrate decarboxylase